MNGSGMPRAAAFGVKNPRDPVLWLHMAHEDARALAGRLADADVTIAAVEGVDWNHDLTPWPSRSIFCGRPDFGGGGEAHLHRLTHETIPQTEARFGLQPSSRWIGGYSLAGLFALWVALRSEMFTAAASVSGSVWYEGFVSFVCNADRLPGAAYLSVGDREKLGRNAAFRCIEDRTREVERILAQRGVRTVFEINPGGHFDDPVGRVERAVRWLANDSKIR